MQQGHSCTTLAGELNRSGDRCLVLFGEINWDKNVIE
jgi:hypothetical protein